MSRAHFTSECGAGLTIDIPPANELTAPLCLDTFLPLFAGYFCKPRESTAKIEDNLFIGSKEAAWSSDKLSEVGITTAIDCAGLPDDRDIVPTSRFSIDDDPSFDVTSNGLLASAVDEVHKAISSGFRVLVYCEAGRSRSGLVVIAYLMKHRGLDLHTAATKVRQARPWVYPNTGFFKQLMKYEETCGYSRSIPEEALILHHNYRD